MRTSALNLDKHGVDFEAAAFVFLGPLLTEPDERKDYGETRYRSVGVAGGTCLLVVHTKVTAGSGSSAPASPGAASRTRIARISLEEIEAKAARGEIRFPVADQDAPDGPDLGDDFWDNAVLVEPPKTRSVHLKIDAEVFRHLLAETGGKGHITRMQNALKAYVAAQKAKAAKAG